MSDSTTLGNKKFLVVPFLSTNILPVVVSLTQKLLNVSLSVILPLKKGKSATAHPLKEISCPVMFLFRKTNALLQKETTSENRHLDSSISLLISLPLIKTIPNLQKRSLFIPESRKHLSKANHRIRSQVLGRNRVELMWFQSMISMLN